MVLIVCPNALLIAFEMAAPVGPATTSPTPK